MKLAWTPLALQDLQHAWDYIATDNLNAADDTMEIISKATQNLLSYPKLGRPGRIKGTRELVVIGTPYIIPYRLKQERIEILAILHHARRWPSTPPTAPCD